MPDPGGAGGRPMPEDRGLIAWTPYPISGFRPSILRRGPPLRSGTAVVLPPQGGEGIYAVCVIARSALARSFSLSDFSWPQAARMSRPRGVRIGLA
jgi:hypothetical protein